MIYSSRPPHTTAAKYGCSSHPRARRLRAVDGGSWPSGWPGDELTSPPGVVELDGADSLLQGPELWALARWTPRGPPTVPYSPVVRWVAFLQVPLCPSFSVHSNINPRLWWHTPREPPNGALQPPRWPAALPLCTPSPGPVTHELKFNNNPALPPAVSGQCLP
jgi:hypothetical protein